MSLQLRSFLYGIYYNGSMRSLFAPDADLDSLALHQDLENNTRLGVDIAFYEQLHSCNRGAGYFDRGWYVVRQESDGTLAVSKGGLTLHIKPQKHLQPAENAAVGELVAIRMPRNLVQNGFYVAVGNAGLRSESHPDRELEIVRIYFNFNPEALHFDDSNSILIYKCPNDYIALQSYYENQEAFPIALAELVGTTLAKLHSQTMSSQKCHAFLTELEECKLNYQLPYPDYLSDYLVSRIEPESLKKTQALSWRFIGIFQQSEAVREVVTELVLNHRHCCLTHNNIQFHKIFIPSHWEKLVSEVQDTDKSLIKIIDWDACSWGDPACDLGKAILGYFLFWLNSMIVHPAIEIKKSIQLATISSR